MDNRRINVKISGHWSQELCSWITVIVPKKKEKWEKRNENFFFKAAGKIPRTSAMSVHIESATG